MITPGIHAPGALHTRLVGLVRDPLFALSALLLLIAATVACDKVPLTAPTGSTVTLSANTTILPINGTAELTATVLESAGTFVQNGTVVTFSTNLGTLEPAEARTQSGKATVRLIAGTRSGRATIRAVSGSAGGSGGGTGTNGGATTTSNEVTIDIGGAAAGRVAISANPTSVSASGGTSLVTAVVFDTSGNRLGGVPVSFTTTAGSLSAAVVTSDANGEARSTLTTTRTATVTATVGGGGEGAVPAATVEITAVAVPVVTVSASPAAPFVGQPVTFAISATPATGAAIRTISINYGDGQSDSLGSTTSVQHTYRSDGSFTVRVTAEDTNGSRGEGSTIIVVTPAPPPLVSLSASPATVNPGETVSFTVTVTPQGGYTPIIDSVTYDFGDGNADTVNSLTRTHLYGNSGNFLAKATVRFTDGTSRTGEAAVRVR
jgi:PKD domain/Bacterial Ig-like domain (group 1)